MNNLKKAARNYATGRRPLGKCYAKVADYINAVGYGGIPRGGFDNTIPGSYWRYAKQFAEYLNKNNNAARLGLAKLRIDNPYKAPPGSIVVVRPGTPGTRHPVAGETH